jgi:hypothetical protein
MGEQHLVRAVGDGATTRDDRKQLLTILYLRTLQEARQDLLLALADQADQAGDLETAVLLRQQAKAFSARAVREAIGYSERHWNRWASSPERAAADPTVEVPRIRNEAFIDLVLYLGGSFDHLRWIASGAIFNESPLQGVALSPQERVITLARMQARQPLAALAELSQVMPNDKLLVIMAQLIEHPEALPAVEGSMRAVLPHLPEPGTARKRPGRPRGSGRRG